jgi:hypothetical protein
VNDAELEQAVLTIIRSITLPPAPPGSGAVTVSYPLVF